MSIDYKKVSDYWNNINTFYVGVYSSNYRILNDEPLGFYRFKGELSFVLKTLPGQRQNYLDIGCGTGNFIDGLRSQFTNLTGLDLSKEMVKISKKRFKEIPNVRIVRANILDYEFSTEKCFDLVLIAEIMLYLQDADIERMLTKITTVVSNQSIIIVRETVAAKKTFVQEKNSHLAIRRTLSDYKSLFEKAGFEVIEVRQNKYYNYAALAGVYRRKMAFLKRTNMKFFENKFVTALLLWLPYKLLFVVKKNLIINYFFVLRKRS